MPITPSPPTRSDSLHDPSPGQRGYPRPQLRRAGWTCLDGPWSFAIDVHGAAMAPRDVAFERTIVVPFSPETARSGIGQTGFYRACWYRRAFDAPELAPGERLILHFGAVDYRATVWIDGVVAAQHVGGYTPFQADITDLVRAPGPHEIVVRAEDDPTDLAKPRGKQDWQLVPHAIWYPRTTGIWQTVWLERVPASRIASLRWAASLERWEIDLTVRLEGLERSGAHLRVVLRSSGQLLAEDVYRLVDGEVTRRIALRDPGIDNARKELLWSPERPTLIDAELDLLGEDGEPLDRVTSYTALRSLSVERDRILLNGRPYPLMLVLDQGYWPETGLTAPDDAAVRRDVELAKAMGFNGVRKHQKIEDPRYLYWADKLGLLVWEEMPSAYRFTPASIARLTREWIEVLARDQSHPCIVAWVPFNESWGVPNLPGSSAQRHYVEALYHLTRAMDPNRLVVGNDGWESVATDVIGIHDYDADALRMARRYEDEAARARLLHSERPGGRLIVLGDDADVPRPLVLSEFGGIACAGDPTATWGYARCETPEALAEAYERLLSVVRSLDLLSGFCYTQFADTYQEANGLLYADRTPKFPLSRIREATSGKREPSTDEQR